MNQDQNNAPDETSEALVPSDSQSSDNKPALNIDGLTDREAQFIQLIRELPKEEAIKMLGNVLTPDVKMEIAESVEYEYRFSSPFPPAQILEQYNRVTPNGADMAIKMVQDEQALNHDLRRSASSRADREQQNRFLLNAGGLGAGFVIAIFGLWITCTMALGGHEVTASLVGVGDLAVLVGLFLHGKNTAGQKTISSQTSPPIEPTQPRQIDSRRGHIGPP